jgi:4-amino-4-deoxy-L-arabinose transferase-like glycosyltransferase
MGLTSARPSAGVMGWLRSRFAWLLLLAGIVLLFAGLSDIYLWQDEAETALISRHFLSYGLPLSTDGRDWVQQAPEMFREFNRDYIWTYHPWLQYLLAAASFAVFGTTTFAARFPFVLAGLATVFVLYHFVSRWLGDARTARVAAVLLLLCVPFVVLVRQCRYYALSALFTLLTVDAYLWLRLDRPWAVPYFVLSAVLLFHSFYAAFFPTLAALVAYEVLTHVWRRTMPQGRVLLALLLIALLILPWVRLIPAWRSGLGVLSSAGPTVEAQSQPAHWEFILGNLGQYLSHITLWVVPLILVPAWLSAWLWARHSKAPGPPLAADQTAFLRIVGWVVAVNIIVLSVLDYTFFRYLTHLMPLLLVLMAMVVTWFIARWPLAGYALLLVLVTSNGLHIIPYKLFNAAFSPQSSLWSKVVASPATRWIDQIRAVRFRSELWMYGQELTYPYDGPNEGLVAYLSAHARPGQTALVNYEDLPLQFYTDLRVLGGLSAHGLTSDPAQSTGWSTDVRPDWIIDRKHGPYRDILADIVAGGSYEKITITSPDIRWENREEARQHDYLTVQGEDPVTLYRWQGD